MSASASPREKIPILLRKPEQTDLDALYIQKNDPEIKRLLGGFSRYQSRRDLEEWLERHRTCSNEILWSIVGQEDGKCLGHVGLYNIDPVARSAEFGIMVGDPSAWGHGVGRQATVKALRHGFFNENLNRISLTVLDLNQRAVALYLSVGFIEEGRLRQAQFRDGIYVDVIAMGLLRDEFRDEK